MLNAHLLNSALWEKNYATDLGRQYYGLCCRPLALALLVRIMDYSMEHEYSGNFLADAR